jgi:hypothetical protein
MTDHADTMRRAALVEKTMGRTSNSYAFWISAQRAWTSAESAVDNA